jgi:hypothetical protein
MAEQTEQIDFIWEELTKTGKKPKARSLLKAKRSPRRN